MTPKWSWCKSVGESAVCVSELLQWIFKTEWPSFWRWLNNKNQSEEASVYNTLDWIGGFWHYISVELEQWPAWIEFRFIFRWIHYPSHPFKLFFYFYQIAETSNSFLNRMLNRDTITRITYKSKWKCVIHDTVNGWFWL